MSGSGFEFIICSDLCSELLSCVVRIFSLEFVFSVGDLKGSKI